MSNLLKSIIELNNSVTNTQVAGKFAKQHRRWLKKLTRGQILAIVNKDKLGLLPKDIYTPEDDNSSYTTYYDDGNAIEAPQYDYNNYCGGYYGSTGIGEQYLDSYNCDYDGYYYGSIGIGEQYLDLYNYDYYCDGIGANYLDCVLVQVGLIQNGYNPYSASTNAFVTPANFNFSMLLSTSSVNYIPFDNTQGNTISLSINNLNNSLIQIKENFTDATNTWAQSENTDPISEVTITTFTKNFAAESNLPNNIWMELLNLETIEYALTTTYPNEQVISIDDSKPEGFTINWGDGSATETMPGDNGAYHIYVSPGTYTITDIIYAATSHTFIFYGGYNSLFTNFISIPASIISVTFTGYNAGYASLTAANVESILTFLDANTGALATINVDHFNVASLTTAAAAAKASLEAKSVTVTISD